MAINKGLMFKRIFSLEGKDPLDAFYEKRDVTITDEKGNVKLSMKGLEFPESWSENASRIVANLYFRKAGIPNTGCETSIKQLIHRISNSIRNFGEKQNYFASKESADIFEDELKKILIEQKASFNSPVWFNFGLYEQYQLKGDSKTNWYWDSAAREVKRVEDRYAHPQGSACFINSVEDSIEGIMELATNEAIIFKGGSGTGTNLSTLRAIGEKLLSGGSSSGILSFYNLFDSVAGSIKSGGATRRAAKMTILNITHPEIREFIKYKSDNEMYGRALAALGYSRELDGEVYHLIHGQNSNFSVRVTDEFMNAVLEGGMFKTREVTTGNVRDEFDAQEVFDEIAVAAWECGDPALQFDTTINKWHTCKKSSRINASNPCSEFMFVDNTACNLASINLMKYLNENGDFDVESFRHTVDVMITAQEIIVDYAAYPKKEMAEKSYKFRPLGLGYANLGALLMVKGLPYNSDEGRALAAVITALMTGRAYRQSSLLAKEIGTFEEYEKNKESMSEVINMHIENIDKIPFYSNFRNILESAKADWADVLNHGVESGFRNAQVTLLAPTGTIGFQMDCDTTGIEPDYSLVKFKKLVDGSVMRIVNNSIINALKNLNYSEIEIQDIIDYIVGNEKKGIEMHGTVENAPHLKKEHYAVFDCANKPDGSERVILPLGHVRMMAAVQPFLSGAISKTVNLPNESTINDIKEIYILSWKLGIKAIALYRDGSKIFQPLVSQGKQKVKIYLNRGEKNPLPQTREGLTLKIEIGGDAFYIRTGEYEDGCLGEIFLNAYKQGSEYRALLDTLAVTESKALQRGMPVEAFVKMYLHTRFDPAGAVNHPHIKNCSSIMDFLARWVGLHYLGMIELAHVKPHQSELRCNQIRIWNNVKNFLKYNAEREQGFPGYRRESVESEIGAESDIYKKAIENIQKSSMKGGPPCKECSTPMIKTGHCYTCPNCGVTSGCG